jgi:hypothetical protein
MTDRPPRGTNPGKPSRIDASTAHSARIYNYWLGGKDNFPADREAAEAAMAANPGIVADVRANRAFLARAVRYLVTEAGVRQFLDIGTGLPTADNKHEVASRAWCSRSSGGPIPPPRPPPEVTAWCGVALKS